MIRFLRRILARLYVRRILQQSRNDVVVVGSSSNVLMGCCDCGLMHRYDFFLDDAGRLCVRARRDLLATAAIRRVRYFTHKPHGQSAPSQPDAHPAAMALTPVEVDRVRRFQDRLDRDRSAS